MGSEDEILDKGREAFQRNAWTAAYEHLSSVDQLGILTAPDLEMLAEASRMLDNESAGDAAREQAHHAFLEADEPERAARNALWLGMELMQRGEFARGGGWIGRGARLVEGRDSVEQGILVFLSGFKEFESGDYGAAHDAFEKAADVGERFGEQGLISLARHGQGRALSARVRPPLVPRSSTRPWCT